MNKEIARKLQVEAPSFENHNMLLQHKLIVATLQVAHNTHFTVLLQ